MSIMNAKQLARQLAGGKIERAYMFYGEEGYLKRHYYETLKDAVLSGGAKEFNLTVLEGSEFSPQQLVDALGSMPVFSEKRLVVVRDLELSSLKKELRALFEQVLETLPETAVLLLYERTVNVDEKLARPAEIIKLFERFGAAVRFDTPGQAELCRWAERHLSQQGKTADPATLRYLLSVTDNGMTSLYNELTKLCHYVPGERVTRRDIDEVVTKSTEAMLYHLTDAVIERRPARALELLAQLFFQRTDEVVIVGGVARELISLYKVRAAAAEGMLPAQIAKSFGLRDFAVRRYLNAAKTFSDSALMEALRVCLDADQSLKTENRDKRLIVETMLGELVRTLGGQGA